MANEPGEVEVSVPESGAKQLETLIRYADQIADIVNRSKNYKPGLTTSEVLMILSKDSSLPYSDLRGIFSSLENLQYLELDPENETVG